MSLEADIKAQEAWNSEGWSVAFAMACEMARLQQVNALSAKALQELGDKANPTLAAIVLAVGKTLDKVAAAGERAMLESGVG